ncbi:MAG: alpha/beta hydrolase [Caldilineaceae bacterium]
MSTNRVAKPQPPPASHAKKQNRLLRWVWRGLIGLLGLLVVLGGVGAIYQIITTARDRRTFHPPGQLVDVGGYKLHISCLGEAANGNPTVILETLSGGMSFYWDWVQPAVTKTTRVCVYDRAGRAWSESSPRPLTLQQTVLDLHTLLKNANVPGPYVLVGHSMGGLYVRKFAADYPNEVAGLVLVDSSHPAQLARYPELQAETAGYLRVAPFIPWLARLGVLHAYFALGGEIDFADMPPQAHTETAAFWSSPAYFASQRAEIVAGPQIFADAQSLGNLGNLPLAVISRGLNPAIGNHPNGWTDLQNELAALSSNSLHKTVDGATHQSLAFKQQDAQVVSAVILQVVEAVRSGKPLSQP